MPKLSNILLVLFFCMVFTAILPAQVSIKSTIRHYGVEDGLSTPFLRAFAEDDKGFLWISHGKGLDRFDGREFKPFLYPIGGKDFNIVVTLVADHDDHLWLVSDLEDVYVFDIQSEEYFKPSEIFKDIFPFDPDDIINVVKSYDVVYLITKNNDVYIYNDKIEKAFSSDSVRKETLDILRPTKYSIWNGKEKEVIEYDFNGDELASYETPFVIGSVKEDNRGQIWVLPRFHYNGEPLGLIRGDSIQLVQFASINENEIFRPPFNVIYDSRGAYSIQHRTSWKTYDHSFRPWVDLYKVVQRSTEEGFGGALNLYQDKYSNLWLATYNGLFFVNSQVDRFGRILTDTEPAVSVRNICEYGDDIFINTYSGGRKLNKASNKIEDWYDENYFVATLPLKDKFLVGGYFSYIYTINTSGAILDSIPYRENTGRTNQIYEDASSQLWFATSGGLGFFNSSMDSIVLTNYFPVGTAVNFINEINDVLWLATDLGLYRLDLSNDRLEYIEPVGNHRVNHFYLQSNRAVWIGTKGEGIAKWDPSTDEVLWLTEKDGLSNNFIGAIYEDHNHHLWITSDNGLMRYRLEDGGIEVFNEEDGIAHREFNLHSHYRSKDSILYFGGLDGVTIVDPKLFDDDGQVGVPIAFTNIEVLKHNEWQSLPISTSSLELNASDRSLRCDFAALDFLEGKKLKYAYKLEGLDEGWNALKENSIRFSSLPSGDFNLKVKVQGSLSEQVLNLPITVKPPFTQTFSFYLLVGALLFGLYRWRIYYLNQQNVTLEATVTARTAELTKTQSKLEQALSAKDRIFGLVAHDMRNAVISFRGIRKKTTYLLKTKQVDRLVGLGDEIDESAKNVAYLLDNLINWARSQQGAMPYNPENIDLKERIDKAINSSKGLKKDKVITVQNLFPEGIIVHADPVGAGIIIRNLLSNAFKFSPDGSTVFLEYLASEDSQVSFQVRDEGVGIPEEKIITLFDLSSNKSSRGTAGESGAGIGLTLVKEIVLQNKGTINVKSEMGKGTTFILTLPMSTSRP